MFEELTKQEEKKGQERLVREGVSIKETQWEKEWGAVRPVGFFKLVFIKFITRFNLPQ